MANWNKKHQFKHRRAKSGTSLYIMLSTCAIMGLLMMVLVVVSKNVTYATRDWSIPLLDVEKDGIAHVSGPAECLLVYEDNDAMGTAGRDEMSEILSQMKVRYDVRSCGDITAGTLDGYSKLVLSVTNYQHLGALLERVKGWVKDGGNLMILYPPAINGSFESLYDILGIREAGTSYAYVESLRFSGDFLLGASRDFTITDAYDSSLSVNLEPDCQVVAQTADEYPTPIIWRHRAGLGTVVVDNFGSLEKGYRGLHSSAYSLLDDACVYPVINASSFYIDDFPSPVPGGYAEYIERDYNISVKDFYTSRWWTDIYNLGEKYGIKYTGLVIEEYSDDVAGPFTRNMDTERYLYFGNMLLAAGGEIGLHGFNHMPLVPQSFDYQGLFDSYCKWPSTQVMYQAVSELKGFCESLYPDRAFQVYVPPSNIISEEGIELLATEFPEVRAIASVYLPGELAYCQEFRVEDNGLVSTPRVIAGYIMDDYVRLVALSELNFHLVSSHFQHPDDVMDEDRGAALGWAKMFENLSDYVDWLYSSVPAIRSLTGSEMAAAVQRYDYVELEQTRTDQGLHLKLTNFYDEAWLMLRLNEGQTIAGVSGGEATRLNGTLYLICAQADEVDIRFS